MYLDRPSHDPHGTFPADPFNTTDEAQLAATTVLVKVRWLDAPRGLDLGWYWLVLGNCRTCVFHSQGGCTNGAITTEQYARYQHRNDCPGYDTGVAADVAAAGQRERDELDVLRAIGEVDGRTSRPLEVLQSVPWTAWASHQAHTQEQQFLLRAHAMDRGVADDEHTSRWADDLGMVEPHGPNDTD